MAKIRTRIPREVAARTLFLSDRTCCVCRGVGKKIQIHHLDGDPSNNAIDNLAVLCTECHDDTELRGGFARKLDSDQVRLYRDDWQRLVAQGRATVDAVAEAAETDASGVRLATSIAEAYRENGEFELLAVHYDAIGNAALRDKYIDLVLAGDDPDDSSVVYLRGLQGRPDLIPKDVVEREESAYNQQKSPLQRARFYDTLGRYPEAARDYVTGIRMALDEGRLFSAAFYLKELADSGITTELFVLALKEAAEEGDLWWQIRALEELGWDDELSALLLEDAEAIEESGDFSLSILLAEARGQTDEAARLREERAAGTTVYRARGGGGVLTPGTAGSEDESKE